MGMFLKFALKIKKFMFLKNFPVENEVDDTQWNDGLLSCNNLAPKMNILDESSILGLTSPSFNTYQMPNGTIEISDLLLIYKH